MTLHTSTRIFSILFFATLIFNSCQEAKLDLSSDALAIKVVNSSGDDFSYLDGEEEHFFAPYPFSQGTMIVEERAYEVMLLSKKIKKGRTVGIRPLAQFTVKQPNGSIEEVIVALPSDIKHQIVDVEDFFGFMVENFALKQIIDHWYANKNGLEGTLVENWRPANISTLSSQ